MKIKQDPVTGLWAREDGAILLPPSGGRFPHFRWTFGTDRGDGYRIVGYKGKSHLVHRIVCRAFHGLPPADKPFCDHKNRVPSANFASNLHWVDKKENADNCARVDASVGKYGVRFCDDPKAYHRARDKSYCATRREEIRAYGAAYAAEKRAQGLTKRKGSDGKYHWLPRIRKSEAV